MNLDALTSVVSRICFAAGFVLLALTVLEELAGLLGSSLVGRAYSPDTLLQVAGVLFVVVIALLLRQIREETKKKNA